MPKTLYIIMDKKLNEICKKFIPTNLTTIPYNIKSYNTIKHKHTL